jgi:hypothetical protein
VHEEDNDDDADFDDGARDADRLRHSRCGMGGNHNHGNNDPFAKTNFTMVPFVGNAELEDYLN